jgi:hypothetical protein
VIGTPGAINLKSIVRHPAKFNDIKCCGLHQLVDLCNRQEDRGDWFRIAPSPQDSQWTFTIDSTKRTKISQTFLK